MATKLEVWNEALRLLGEPALVTLTDDVPSRYVLEEAYPRVVLNGLMRGVWNFAIKTVEIQHNENATPSIGYQFAFDKPDDWLFTNVLSSFPDFQEFVPTLYQNFRDQGGRWHTDTTPLYAEYVSSDFAADENISAWSENFVQFISAQLAFETEERITHSSDLYERLNALTARRLARAKSRDAKDEREHYVRPGSWARAQRGYGFQSNRQRLQSGGQIQLKEGEV